MRRAINPSLLTRLARVLIAVLLGWPFLLLLLPLWLIIAFAWIEKRMTGEVVFAHVFVLGMQGAFGRDVFDLG